MSEQSFGNMIVTLRKNSGMTQKELAEKMCVTDKAVSKWERDLSFPDVNSLPKLAEIFGVTVDELINAKTNTPEKTDKEKIAEMIPLIFKAISLAMGITVAVLSAIDKIETSDALGMLGIGLSCLALTQIKNKFSAF